MVQGLGVAGVDRRDSDGRAVLPDVLAGLVAQPFGPVSVSRRIRAALAARVAALRRVIFSCIAGPGSPSSLCFAGWLLPGPPVLDCKPPIAWNY